MPRRAVIVSLPQAFEMVKELHLPLPGWQEEDWRPAARQAIAALFEERMARSVDSYLEEIARKGGTDRRNGHYTRHLLTAMGDIELQVPRTRRFSAVTVVKAYARRTADIENVILAGFVLGLSTRKISKTLLSILGEPVSPSLVSRIAKNLDVTVQAFHERRILDGYKVVIFDGVVLARKTGAGAIRRPVLVALGIRPDGRKEIIDFRLAASESQVEWERFLNDLYRRGLTGETELVCADGGKGLLAALGTVYPNLPLQRCWAHKVRNLTDKVRKADREAVKKGLREIYCAKALVRARRAARCWSATWEAAYPKVVASLRSDLDELLAFLRFKDEAWRKATRTTNAIERKFVEVRRRTRPMGVFSDRTSMERILFAVFTNENRNQGICTPLLLTHKC